MARQGRHAALAERVAPRTVIYIHGIGNKPKPSILKCQWDRALFRVAQHDRTRMAYWVNREFYPTPEEATCLDSDVVAETLATPGTTQLLAFKAASTQATAEVNLTIDALAGNDPDRRKFLEGLADDLRQRGEAMRPSTIPGATTGALGWGETIGDAVWRWLTEKVTETLLRDVHDFFYEKERRDVMEKSLMQYLRSTAKPHVIIAHSQGTMIAYNVLRQLPADEFSIPLLITMGSPLALPMVMAEFRKREFLGNSDFDVPACVQKWVNVSARFDIVCAVPELSGPYQPANFIVDELINNPDGIRNAHSGTGYLRSEPVQLAVRDVLGADFGQAANPFVIARDVEDMCHDSLPEVRHPVLIQMGESGDLEAAHEGIRDVLKMIFAETKVTDWQKAASYDPLKRFVSIKLTRREIDRVRTVVLDGKLRGVSLDVKVWRNAEKNALIYQSLDTLQVRPAATAYSARGKQIEWAVLDSGVRADHPHFAKFENVVSQWNCLKQGDPIPEWGPAGGAAGMKLTDLDPNGHGTHVAGIIAGAYDGLLEIGDPAIESEVVGMAPETRIHSYRVLDAAGNGNDAAIIKALDHIAMTNERAGKLVIHGANLSLGGQFDPTMYGCGHSPLCQELRRLWRQGVVIVLAAGNSGQVRVASLDNSLIELNTVVSIGDPANLGDAIAVGSVHKTNPHMHGISFFSSRGPTMDGRVKPDCVAPGERVLSARADFREQKKPRVQDLYIEMSGTSMAAPHVSGLIAAFLSLRREFIGYPDKVKRILKDNCTDLDRERYAQGKGMPNLVRMLVAT